MGQYHFDKLYFEAGVQPTFLLSAKYINQAFADGELLFETKENITDQRSTFDFRIDLGAGYNLSDKLGVGIRYNYGLTPVNKNTDRVTLKNSLIQVSLTHMLLQ